MKESQFLLEIRDALLGVHSVLNQALDQAERHLKHFEQNMNVLVEGAAELEEHKEYLDKHGHEDELTQEQLRALDEIINGSK